MDEELRLVQTQLTATIKMQLDSASSGLRVLESAQTRLSSLRDRMSGVVRLAHASTQLMSETSAANPTAAATRYHSQYALIRAVSLTQSRFYETRLIYEQLAGLEMQVDRATSLMKEDWRGNMLLVGAIVTRLCQFKEETLKMAGEGEQALAFNLRRYFQRVDVVKERFEQCFWEEPPKIFQLLISKEYSVIVKMAKILSRMPSEAQSRMISEFDEVVQGKFAGVRGLLSDGSQPLDETLKQLSFFLPDLLLVRDGLSARFPAFPTLKRFILAYHRNIANCLQIVFQSREGMWQSGDTLEILAWTSEYYKLVEENFAVSQDELEPRLLDSALEKQLSHQFVRDSGGKVSEWISNLVKNELATFAALAVDPSIDSADRYFSSAIVDLTRIYQQTVETARASGSTELFTRVLTETSNSVCEVYVRSVSNAIKAEREKQQQRPSSRFESYVVMFANSAFLWIEFSTKYLEGLPSDPSTDDRVRKQLKLCNEAFLQLAKETIEVLTWITLKTVRPVLGKLFVTTEWQNGTAFSTIDVTIADFMCDWKMRSDTFYYNSLVGELLSRLLGVYFEYLLKVKHFKQAMLPVITQDLDKLTATYKRFREDAERTARAIEPARQLIKCVFASSPRVLHLDALSWLKQAGEQGCVLLESLVGKRQEDPVECLAAVEGAKRKWREDTDRGSAATVVNTPAFLNFVSIKR